MHCSAGRFAGAGRHHSFNSGEILTAVAGCTHCHTAIGGEPFAGGRELITPFGVINSPNITPHDTGIGDWDSGDFEQALRHGKRPNGLPLYPAMPYAAYTKMSDADIDAIWEYVSNVAPVENDVDVIQLPFPYNIRPSVLAWQTLYFEEGRFEPDPAQSDKYNLGAYLSEAMAHCGICHTPRDALEGQITERRYQGASIETAYAPNITLSPDSALQKFDEASLAAFLRDAPTNNIPAFSEMELVSHGLSQAPKEYAETIAHYILNSQEPIPAVISDDPEPLTDEAFERGKSLYETTCVGSHGEGGLGGEGVAATLVNNGGVEARSPVNAITVVLAGAEASALYGPMPSFAEKLSDEEIADIANYVRRDWGNAGYKVATPAYVGAVRGFTDVDPNPDLGLLCRTIPADTISDGLNADLAALAAKSEQGARNVGAVIDPYQDEIKALPQRVRMAALTASYCQSLAESHPGMAQPVFIDNKLEFVHELGLVLRDDS